MNIINNALCKSRSFTLLNSKNFALRFLQFAASLGLRLTFHTFTVLIWTNLYVTGSAVVSISKQFLSCELGWQQCK